MLLQLHLFLFSQQRDSPVSLKLAAQPVQKCFTHLWGCCEPDKGGPSLPFGWPFVPFNLIHPQHGCRQLVFVFWVDRRVRPWRNQCFTRRFPPSSCSPSDHMKWGLIIPIGRAAVRRRSRWFPNYLWRLLCEWSPWRGFLLLHQLTLHAFTINSQRLALVVECGRPLLIASASE